MFLHQEGFEVGFGHCLFSAEQHHLRSGGAPEFHHKLHGKDARHSPGVVSHILKKQLTNCNFSYSSSQISVDKSNESAAAEFARDRMEAMELSHEFGIYLWGAYQV